MRSFFLLFLRSLVEIGEALTRSFSDISRTIESVGTAFLNMKAKHLAAPAMGLILFFIAAFTPEAHPALFGLAFILFGLPLSRGIEQLLSAHFEGRSILADLKSLKDQDPLDAAVARFLATECHWSEFPIQVAEFDLEADKIIRPEHHARLSRQAVHQAKIAAAKKRAEMSAQLEQEVASLFSHHSQFYKAHKELEQMEHNKS